jgi:hypothetical protein
MPASIRTLPSGPVSTATLPPEPSSALTLPRSLWTLIGASAAEARMASTMLRDWAKTSLGLSQPPVAAKVVEARQQRQNPRRDSMGR